MPALGFAVVALVLGPLIALVARRRWMRAAARRAEVLRLALLAAEEAALAEEEALRVACGRPVPAAAALGPRMAVCAVCHSPTTTRCSRCKAVRYCSGKCQIIHWRQGHKNECSPPQVDDHYDGLVGVKKLKGLTAEGSELCNDSLETGGNLQEEAAVKFFKKLSSESSYSSEAFSDDEFIDSSGTESTSDSSSDSLSSSCSIFSDRVGSFDDYTSTVNLNLLHKSGTGQHLSSDVSHDKLRATVEQRASSSATEEAKSSASGSKLIYAKSYLNFRSSKEGNDRENGIAGLSVSESARAVDSRESRIYQENHSNQLDVKPHLQTSSKLSDEVLRSQTKARNEILSSRYSMLGVAQTDCTSSATSVSESGSLDSSRNYGVKIVRSKSLMSAPSAFVNQASPAGHFRSDDASTKVQNAPKPPAKLYQNAGSHSSDIKTSVQRVVQQLKLSKVSRQHKSSLGNDFSKKSKMLFPYDYFVKLYKFDKVVIHPSGLINCRNSCYANAVLQCLAFTPPLNAYLLQGLHSKTCPKREWCFTCELESLLIKAKLGQSPLSPAAILSHLHEIGRHLGNGREEDAHEFLRYAIEAMQSICLKEAGAHAVDRWAEQTTLIQLTFGGYLRSKIECMNCHSKSERYERMMDLTVEIEGNVGTLEEALRQFTNTEILDGENKYHCPRCKSYEQAKKKLTILEAPNILTIALKRFQSGKFGKLNKAVRFPEYLDVAPYMHASNDKSPGYKLYAVVVHLDVMNASFSGHYVCYVKNRQGKWYKTDDSVVQPVELEQVLSKNAYMLFYARCSPHSPSLISSTLSQEQVASKWSRSKEAFYCGSDREKASSNVATAVPDSPAALHRSRDEPNDWATGYRVNCEPYNPYHGIFDFPITDSSSDSSSLFSCSDEGSCSTESTRNSTSTDEYSDYIFGGLDRHSWNSPLRLSNDLDGTLSFPFHSAPSSEAASYRVDRAAVDRQDTGSSLLFSDATNQCRKLREYSSRSIENVLVNSSKLKSNVLRSSSTARERTAETFYR